MAEPDSHPEGAPDGGPGRLARPRPTLRVGITGHRPNKLPGDLPERIRQTLAGTMRAIEASLLRLQASSRPGCRLVTALAEGADSLAAEAAPAHWEREALLPMPRAVYAADFLPEGETTSPALDALDRHLACAASVTELPLIGRDPAPTGAARDRQYEALGRALVRRIDCLIAVWDGAAAAGIGGTASVLAEALDHGMGVVWIDPAAPDGARLIARLEQGEGARPVSAPADDGAFDALVCTALARQGARTRCDSGASPATGD
ncbi:hypothetical protein [Enterovirga rhinocerotis]|uniref:Uncharacterized protein n=1 Tax=Enterovirga rhinocerotis TaxID=1339210 RepID=A0A4R7BW07_9HYPH|nr:hypothetical protein [Enterovirga rhinocerotis]TDR88126.1 hypothetical protein EV668_3995 [Enterovirga rhinocerotis]